jgi:hypothetical protein
MTRSIIRQITQPDGSPFDMGGASATFQISDDIHTQRAFGETGHFQMVMSNALQGGDQAILYLLGRTVDAALDVEVLALDLSTFVAPALTEIAANIQMYPIMRVVLFTIVNPTPDADTKIRAWLQE